MNANATFAAPWSSGLRTMTIFSVVLLLGVILIGIFSLPQKLSVMRWGVSAVPLVILFATALFTVRGYEIRGHELLVKRLAWSTRIDLRNLQSATSDSTAFSGAMRIAGNGGLFAFTGMFRNQKLGRFRAFATDPRRSVVLRFETGKPIVVTPDEPERFVQEITKAK